MLSRRLLRVKVMQVVYAYSQRGEESIEKAEKELFHSISKSHELYHFMLLLLVELKAMAERRIEANRQKIRPTPEELNPNMRFLQNQVIGQLESNTQLLRYIRESGLSWANHTDVVKNIFQSVVSSDLYQEYMQLESSGYETDKKFVIKLMEKVIAPIDDLYQLLEEQSIYWNDEIEFVISMVIKTIKSFELVQGEEAELLPDFKDQDDRNFVTVLLRKSLLNKEESYEWIRKFSKNWDFDRVAYLDIVLMQMALTEVLEFQQIPVKVTLNEYIEIAKFYSTNKSGNFINGILDKVVDQLVEEKRIIKPLKD